MSVLGDVELALAESVPELDGAVTGTRHDLTVVGRERDAEDVTSVADELPGGQTSVEVPEAEGVVPRGRKGKLTVRGDDDVGHEVVVAVEDLLGETKVTVLTGQLPDDDGLVCKRSVFACLVELDAVNGGQQGRDCRQHSRTRSPTAAFVPSIHTVS